MSHRKYSRVFFPALTLCLALVAFAVLAPGVLSAPQTPNNSNAKPGKTQTATTSKPRVGAVVLRQQAGATKAGPRPSQTGPKPDQIRPKPGQTDGPVATYPIPPLAAKLSASKTTHAEFVHYLNQLSTSEKLHFKLGTLAQGAHKVVWQVGSQPFEKPKHGTDWKTAAGLLKSGEATFSKPESLFAIDLPTILGQPTPKGRRVYVRALVINNGRLAAHPSNAVVVDYKASSSTGPTVTLPDNPLNKPRVQTKVTVVAYKPPVRWSDPCRFILTKTPPAGELKTILSKIKATTPGTHFSLCQSDYAYIKSRLSAGEWAAIALQDFLKVLKSGYNWLDSKYNFVENNLVSALDAVGIDPKLARKAINYYKAIYGMSPNYGNFDEALDTGKDALSVFVAGAVPDDQKEKVEAQIGKFVNDVKSYANGGGDSNQFYRMDPEYAARPAYVLLRVRYEAINGAPANMVGGKSKISVKVTSGRTVDKSTLNSSFSSGHQEWPPLTLAEKSVELPDAQAGTVIDIPVYVDYSSYYKSDEYRWTQGYNSTEPGVIAAGSSTLKWAVNKKYSQK
jgi:hypothetical protein